MKQLIMDVLKDMSRGQVNLESKSARETIADSIIVAIKTNNGGKGWFLDLSTLDGEAKLTPEELEVYESDGDEIAKALGHMDTDGNFITEDMPEGLRRAKELSQEAIEEGMRRTKNDMQLEHENKVFDTAGEEIDPVNSYFTADVKDDRDSEEYVEDIDEQAHAQGRGSSFGGDTGTDADFNIPPGEEIDGMYFDDEVQEWEEAVAQTEKYEEEKEKAKQLIDKSVEDFERNKLSEEIIDDKEKDYIYESSDGGKTIYRREFGSDKCEEIKIEKVKK